MVQRSGIGMGTRLNRCSDVGEPVQNCAGMSQEVHNNLLAVNFYTLKNKTLSRYITFYRSMLSSPSKEVAVVAGIVGKNASTTKGLNLLKPRH